MTNLSRYALLLSLSCLTPLTARAEIVTSGEDLFDAISANTAGSSVLVELGNEVTLPSALAVSGNAVVDGTEAGYAVDGSGHAGFSLSGEGNSLSLKNTVLKNFNGSSSNGLIVDNGAGATAILENVTVENNTMAPIHSGQTYVASGAFIKNSGEMSIDGKFMHNTATTNAGSRGNGALIANFSGHIGKLSGVFADNLSERTYDGGAYMYGGVLWQGGSNASVDEMNGTFERNQAHSFNSSAYGGVAYINLGSVGALKGTYTANKAVSSYSNASGGVLFNKNDIGLINANFISNESNGRQDGSSFSHGKSYGGAIYNSGTIAKIENSLFEGNKATAAAAQGGAIYNYSSSGKIGEIVNTSFKNNLAQKYLAASSTQVQGGGIFTKTNLVIKADAGGLSEFSGNKVIEADGAETSNAIWMDSKLNTGSGYGNIKLEATTNGKIVFNDAINGVSGYTITVDGDESGRVELNSKIENAASVTSSNVTLALGQSAWGAADLSDVALTINSGTLDLENDVMQNVSVGAFSSSADTKIKLDADLSSGESDKITASSVGAGSQISLGSLNILNDGAQDITVFAGGNAPTFANLSDFAAFTDDFKYTFKSENAGILSTDVIEANKKGLNAAVADETITKSYTLSDGDNVYGDLGELKGDALTILGNGNVLDGSSQDGLSSYAGLVVAAGQMIKADNVSSIENFASENGGFVKSSGEIDIVNSSVKNNTAAGNGGAVWSDGKVNVAATDGKNVEFSGNMAAGASNAIYMAAADSLLNINADGGKVVFNDGIDGAKGYNVVVGGSADGEVRFNQTVANAGAVEINGAAVYLDREDRLNGSSLSLNGGNLRLDNGTIATGARFKTLSGGNGVLHLDVDTVNLKADKITAENLAGKVNVVAHNLADDKNTGYSGGESIKFAEVANASDGSFNILRVENSIYEWLTTTEAGDNGSTDWLMSVKQSGGNNPGDDKPVVVAEVAAYLGLNGAGFEQTRNLARNVEDKVAATVSYDKSCCGFYDYAYNGKPLYNLWVAPVYNSAEVDTPAKFDADIYGLEAGADMQGDVHNRLGLFVSYRHGEYDFDGKNDYYAVTTSSDVKIDSYLAGLYYRYSRGALWTTATVFGGIQKAELKTADGIKEKPDATEIGAVLTGGYGIALPRRWLLEPQASVSYTRIAWDDFRDQYGKNVNFDKASQWELEAGVKLEKAWNLNGETAKFYVKPSIIQVLAEGDSVSIGGQRPLDSLDDRTLFRIGAGMSYQLNDRLNIFGNAGYIFGSDYENIAVGFGLNWAF